MATIPSIEVRRVARTATKSAHTLLRVAPTSELSGIEYEFGSCDELERWLKQGLQSVAVARTTPATEG